MILICILTFFIQSNVYVCGNSDVYHIDSQCEGLSNCKSKLSIFSLTSLSKNKRLCGYEKNEKVIVCGDSDVFHRDENCQALSNCRQEIKKADLSSVINSKKFCGWENTLIRNTSQQKKVSEIKPKDLTNDDKFSRVLIFFLGLMLVVLLIYLSLNFNKPSLNNKKDDLEDRLSNLEKNRVDESKINDFINAKIKDLEKRKFTTKIQIIKNTEHLPYLIAKFLEANNYIIITSGWITKSVVDDRFLDLLKEKINQKVKILFIYGYKFNNKHDGSDDLTIKKLNELSNSSNGYFFLKIIPSNHQGNHSKCLIFDNNEAAIGSYNWLSTGSKSYNIDKSVIVKDTIEVKKEAIHFLKYFGLESWANS